MALLRIDEPAIEPVGLEEAKHYLRIDIADDDDLVAGLIAAARTHIEQLLGRIMIAQTWVEVRDGWPVAGDDVRLSLTPVLDVLDVRVVGADGVSDQLPATDYFADVVSDPPRLRRTGVGNWPQPGRTTNGVEIEFAAGYGEAGDDVPQPLRQAVLLLVAHWYEQREPVSVGAGIAEVPQTVAGLIAPYRTRRVA